jgi:DNA uptake protein ComE-like DNA-binding protein
MAAILITKVIHAQITHRQEWIIKGIIECSEFNQSDSAYVRSLSSSLQNKIWSQQLTSKNNQFPKGTIPLNPLDTFYLNHPLLVIKSNIQHSKNFEVQHINLNTCDSIFLESLPKIGPTTASKIIRYRERLGGYVSPFQLLEIYRIDSQILQIPGVIFNTQQYESAIIKIPRNQLTIKDLYRHPYIGKSKASWFWKFLQTHPKFTKEDFMNTHFLTNEEKQRLTPYLNFKL